jgi:regulator of sirC expression with transglutaminase-like and TPR domain
MIWDLEERYKEVGETPDEDINLAEAALSLAAEESPGISLERYQHHITKLINEVSERHEQLLKEGAQDDAQTCLAALKHILYDKYEYQGDVETYDDLQNANLIRVIERRKGLPVTISLLAIHIGEAQGWEIEGLNFPAHVICRIEKNGERVLFDPFNRFQVMQASDLRQLLKTLVRPDAELAASYYEPATKRDLLIRLQNNIKLRQIEDENYTEAVKTVERMQAIDPEEYRLLFDAGVLYARTNQVMPAIESLEKYIDRTPYQADKQDALALLQQIRDSLN